MKNDALYDYVKSQLENGISADDLFEIFSKAEDDYNEEREKRAKVETQKKVQEELKKRAAEDVYNAYVEYFNSVYPSKELPKDAEKLFKAELDFIDYMMTGAVGKAKDYNDYNDFINKFFKSFI